MTARKALSRKQVVALCLLQEGRCGCGCGKKLDPIGEGVIDEHVLPRELGAPEDIAARDDLSNRALFRKPCASRKTAADLKQIAKAKRQAGETGQQRRRADGKTKPIAKSGNAWPKGRKMPSRPFQKAQNRERAVRVEE